MKKLCCVLAALVISSAAFAQEGMDHWVGAGFTMPIGNITFGSGGTDADTSWVAPGINITYLGIMSNNVSFKADFSACAPQSDDFDGWDCTELLFDVGAGYSIINWDSLSLTALGMLGMSFNSHGYGPVSLLTLQLDVGADVVAMYKFFNFIGVYASFGVRYRIPLYGELDLGSYTLSDEIYLKGWEFTPTIGVAIHF